MYSTTTRTANVDVTDFGCECNQPTCAHCRERNLYFTCKTCGGCISDGDWHGKGICKPRKPRIVPTTSGAGVRANLLALSYLASRMVQVLRMKFDRMQTQRLTSAQVKQMHRHAANAHRWDDVKQAAIHALLDMGLVTAYDQEATDVARTWVDETELREWLKDNGEDFVQEWA